MCTFTSVGLVHRLIGTGNTLFAALASDDLVCVKLLVSFGRFHPRNLRSPVKLLELVPIFYAAMADKSVDGLVIPRNRGGIDVHEISSIHADLLKWHFPSGCVK